MVKTLSYQLFKKIRERLIEHFSEEADSLAFIIVEHFSGFNKTDIIADRTFGTDPQFESHINSIIERLFNNEPIQYVLGIAYFYDRPFIVNKHTLIPRQETEELVYLILENTKTEKNLSVLDIGTGSGCIPITLKLEEPSHQLEAIDISKSALEIARENARRLGVTVEFKQLDVLTNRLPKNYDIIISNPPYVLSSEKSAMKDNVLDFEPHLALFVENDNPLLFYKRITELATKCLKPKGRLYFEINEQFGEQVVELLKKNFFREVKLHQDLNGKDRIVSARLNQ